MRVWRAFYWWKREHPVLALLAWAFIGWPVFGTIFGFMLDLHPGDTVMGWSVAILAVLSLWFVLPAGAAVLGFDSAPDAWRNIQAQEAARRHYRRR